MTFYIYKGKDCVCKLIQNEKERVYVYMCMQGERVGAHSKIKREGEEEKVNKGEKRSQSSNEKRWKEKRKAEWRGERKREEI